jgi:hypothetical protein
MVAYTALGPAHAGSAPVTQPDTRHSGSSLLRSRLADYDYARHVGGAVYLFLRGHAAPGQGLHVERPPWALIEALDQMFSGSVA